MSEYKMSRIEALTFPLSAGFALVDAVQYRRGNDSGSGYVDKCVQREVAKVRRYLHQHYNILPPPPRAAKTPKKQ